MAVTWVLSQVVVMVIWYDGLSRWDQNSFIPGPVMLSHILLVGKQLISGRRVDARLQPLKHCDLRLMSGCTTPMAPSLKRFILNSWGSDLMPCGVAVAIVDRSFPPSPILDRIVQVRQRQIRPERTMAFSQPF